MKKNSVLAMLFQLGWISTAVASGFTVPAVNGTIYNSSDLAINQIQVVVSALCICNSIAGETDCGHRSATATANSSGHFQIPSLTIPKPGFFQCISDINYSDGVSVVLPDGEERRLLGSVPTGELNITMLQIDPASYQVVLPNGQDASKWMASNLVNGTINADVNIFTLDSNGNPDWSGTFSQYATTTTSNLTILSDIVVLPVIPSALPQARISFMLRSVDEKTLCNFQKNVPYSRSMLSQVNQLTLATSVVGAGRN